MPNDFWPLFLANLPVVSILFWALHKKIIIMGVTFQREMDSKDKDIEFREQLRQEALADKKTLEATNKDMANAIDDLRDIVSKSVDLTENLVEDNLRLKAVADAQR